MRQADQSRKSPLSRGLELRAAPGPQNLQLSKALGQTRLPELAGKPIVVSTRPVLVAQRGRLGSDPASGAAVYGAAFLRDRKIILEAALLSDAQGFHLILIHELFHFVWMRLGNRARAEFVRVLLKEWKHGARGELGESSAVRKELLREGAVTGNAKPWRDYACESFCDTAAWLYADGAESELFTLRKRWREGRKAWFEAAPKRGVWRC